MTSPTARAPVSARSVSSGTGEASGWTPGPVTLVNTAAKGGGAERVGVQCLVGLQARGVPVSLRVRAVDAGPEATRRAGVVPLRDAPFERQARYFLRQRAGVRDVVGAASFALAAGRGVTHLHNLHGDYFNLAALPLIARRGPLVWTLHDSWAVTGGCAFPEEAPGPALECARFRTGCGACPQRGVYPVPDGPDQTDALWRMKHAVYSAAAALAGARVVLAAPSQALLRRVRGSPLARALGASVVHVPNGVEVDTFRPVGGQGDDQDGLPTVLLYYGAHDPRKNGEAGLRALAALANAGQCRALVVARDEDCGAVERAFTTGVVEVVARADGCSSEGRAVLAGYYQRARLLLFPSRAENAPLTTLEAMACGAAVVTAPLPGVAEQTVGVPAFSAADPSPEALEAALAEGLAWARATALDEQAIRAALHDHIATRFNVETMIDQYVALYER